MAKKIIQLHNGRIKRTGNRIGGDTSSIDTRYRRRDNEHRAHLRHQQFNLDARQAIEECDMIGPRGIINKNSSDYPAQEPRREKKPRHRSHNRSNNRHDGRDNFGYASHFAAPAMTMTTVTVKKSRPAFKVIIDEGGTMRAIPLM